MPKLPSARLVDVDEATLGGMWHHSKASLVGIFVNGNLNDV